MMEDIPYVVEKELGTMRSQAAFQEALNTIRADQIMDILPDSFIMWHVVPEFPGIARFPVDRWLLNDAPTFSARTWCKLVIRITEEAPDRLRELRELTMDYERNLVDWVPPIAGVLGNIDENRMEDDEVQQWPASHQWYHLPWQGTSSSSWQ